MSKPQIAFYGLGAMGGGMATNLAKKGYPITGFDVYTPLIDKLVSAGGSPASTPAAAASSPPASIAIIMVATMHQATSLLFEGSSPAISGLPRNAVLILCSTCPPSYPEQLQKLLHDNGRGDVQLLDCPVSGGTIRAAAGSLSIFASGPDEALRAADGVLRDMSANLYPVAGGISGGQKVKCIHQLLAATNIISASEAMGLAAAAGLDARDVYEYVKTEGRGTSFMFENRAPHMLDDDWTVLSALGIIWKDAGIVVDAAKEVRFPVPLANAAEQLYVMGHVRGLLKEDDARLVVMYLPEGEGAKVGQLAGKGEKAKGKGGIGKEEVDDLLAGVHLAASVEAMAFCKALGMERKMMYEIISKAAGWCKVYTTYIEEMLEADEWTLKNCKGAEEIRKRLEGVVDKCRAIGFPCQMASTALQQYYFAGLGTPKW
ncbi:NAD binding domain of 6-phosphogluconate dehydrogenase-domain-containing protein [Elsinoe ampelina]|uniref:NAD binding domain of 6-phosphogluconate dehydrogenase-domain-containing protein n=1 Tax=Elsinoe ampelina TaxID=302913 RepID=A0A6A6G214_9PEZI|nr:NAD binding domain of 6-phosphogluconate dehydrogenase-domain-containing protein [Elsinoe ampelina]